MTKLPFETDFGVREEGEGFKKVGTGKSLLFRVVKFIAMKKTVFKESGKCLFTSSGMKNNVKSFHFAYCTIVVYI